MKKILKIAGLAIISLIALIVLALIILDGEIATTINTDDFELPGHSYTDNRIEKEEKVINTCSSPNKIIEGCKKGETVETIIEKKGLKAKFTCLGVIDNNVTDYIHFKLKNGKILLYSESSPTKNAKLFNPDTNEFIAINNDIKTTDYPVYTKKELPNYLNYFTPELLYDSNVNEFLKISDKEYSKYLKFLKKRKKDTEEAILIQRFEDNKFFYSNGGYRIWLEEPLKLKRYKYGKLHTPRIRFLAALLNDGKIYIFRGLKPPFYGNISLSELYNPISGNVSNLNINSENANSFYHLNENFYSTRCNYNLYWTINSNKDFSKILKNIGLCSLKNNNKFIYKTKEKIQIGIVKIKDQKNIIYNISTHFKRIKPEISNFGDGKLLITGGFYSGEPSNCYMTAELFELEEL